MHHQQARLLLVQTWIMPDPQLVGHENTGSPSIRKQLTCTSVQMRGYIHEGVPNYGFAEQQRDKCPSKC